MGTLKPARVNPPDPEKTRIENGCDPFPLSTSAAQCLPVLSLIPSKLDTNEKEFLSSRNMEQDYPPAPGSYGHSITDGQMNGWMHGQMDGWVGGHRDGQTGI